jgi:type II secretory ATPase GspE/PulE/Tfp pilus assembly ATPase PilB-like protein
MAIRASLTGHLVFSTIHTNSAWSVVERLLDMGVPRFLLSSTLNTAVAQRLVRKLCNHCKKEIPFDKGLLEQIDRNLFKPPKTHFIPTGCQYCHHSGYSGRKAVFEVINIDSQMREIIKDEGHRKSDITDTCNSTLEESAYDQFLEGITSLEEVMPIMLSQL